MDSAPCSVTTTPLKVLALHGSGGTGEEFPKRLTALKKALAFHSASSDGDTLELEITSIQAPFVKENGFSWWTMPPGVRSFNAEEYTGFEESATRVVDVWESGGFDVVLGHSQGAILVGALLALKRTPYHPPGGYIMNGVSFPNPYSKELESLVEDTIDGESAPRILFLLGKRDKIAPNPTGEKLRDLLDKGGFEVSSCYHDGGHAFPEEDAGDTTMKTVAEWIMVGRRQTQ
jgi:predicted esterase